MVFKLATALLSPSGTRARLTVVCYHRVLARENPLRPDTPDAARFTREIRWLKDQFSVLPLGEAVERLFDGCLPARAASVTFDDGYRDNLTVAAPVLRDAGVRATLFLSTAYLDGRLPFFEVMHHLIEERRAPTLDLRPWALGSHSLRTPGDRIAAIHRICTRLKYRPDPDRIAAEIADRFGGRVHGDDMLSPDDVVRIAEQGFDVGGHSHEHRILTTIPGAEAVRQLRRNRDVVAQITGHAPTVFAYPNGKPRKDYTPTHQGMIAGLGYLAAFSTEHGACTATAERFALPRITTWETRPLRFKAQLLRNLRRTPSAAPPPSAPDPQRAGP